MEAPEAPEVPANARLSSRSTKSTARHHDSGVAGRDAQLRRRGEFVLDAQRAEHRSEQDRQYHDRRDFHRNGQPSNEARDTVGCACSTAVGPLASMPYHSPPGQLTFK
jgi:hypothetical protein